MYIYIYREIEIDTAIHVAIYMAIQVAICVAIHMSIYIYIYTYMAVHMAIHMAKYDPGFRFCTPPIWYKEGALESLKKSAFRRDR